MLLAVWGTILADLATILADKHSNLLGPFVSYKENQVTSTKHLQDE
jgi:hypothetical protein